MRIVHVLLFLVAGCVNSGLYLGGSAGTVCTVNADCESECCGVVDLTRECQDKQNDPHQCPNFADAGVDAKSSP